MVLFVVDGHFIYRSGVTACLIGLEDVEAVIEAGSIPDAYGHPELLRADVVLVDDVMPGTNELIRLVCDEGSGRVVVCSSSPDERRVIASVQAGAIGYLRKDSLTSESLASAIRAASDGAGVMAPELLGTLLRTLSRVSRDMLEPRGLSLSRLTEREQKVLRLVAAGRADQGGGRGDVLQRAHHQERAARHLDQAGRADALAGGCRGRARGPHLVVRIDRRRERLHQLRAVPGALEVGRSQPEPREGSAHVLGGQARAVDRCASQPDVS